MPAIDVRHTLDRLEANLGLLAGERTAAAVRALNRTMTTVRAEAAREMRPEYPGLRISQLKARMKLERATGAKPSAAVVFSGGRFSLYGNFGMRGLAHWGVRFGKLPWRIETPDGEAVTPEMIARAFRQRSRRGGVYVFSRFTKKRESFAVLLAPGLARAFAERGIGKALQRVALERFAVVFEQEAKFRLSKR